METLKKKDQEFKKAEHVTNANAMYISSNMEGFSKPSNIEKPGIYYILSIEPDQGMPEVMPTAEEVLKAAPEIAHFKSSALSYPANEKSLIKVNGKKYQIRYFIFDWKDQPNKTFSQMAKEMNLGLMKVKLSNYGYGDLYVFSSSEDMKSRGIKFTLSLAEVRE